jgi:hypothetical protein
MGWESADENIYPVEEVVFELALWIPPVIFDLAS